MRWNSDLAIFGVADNTGESWFPVASKNSNDRKGLSREALQFKARVV
jgi:hypothetical protein